MKVERKWFEQAVTNWATNDKVRTAKSFSIEGLDNVTFLCSKSKTASRCLVYFCFTHQGHFYGIRIGDWYNEALEDITRTNVIKFSALYPLNLKEIENLAQRVYSIGKDWRQVLAALKTKFPRYRLEQIFAYRRTQSSASSMTVKTTIPNNFKPVDKPKVIAGSSIKQAEPIASIIDPLKEIKLKNLEQELELIDLKIRKCEILKEISSLKQG